MPIATRKDYSYAAVGIEKNYEAATRNVIERGVATEGTPTNTRRDHWNWLYSVGLSSQWDMKCAEETRVNNGIQIDPA